MIHMIGPPQPDNKSRIQEPDTEINFFEAV
jgi:hypothetical protein